MHSKLAVAPPTVRALDSLSHIPPLSKQKERYHLPIMSYVIIYDSLKILIITQFPDILCVIKCQEKCHKGAYYTSPSIIAEVVQLQSHFSGALITHKF